MRAVAQPLRCCAPEVHPSLPGLHALAESDTRYATTRVCACVYVCIL